MFEHQIQHSVENRTMFHHLTRYSVRRIAPALHIRRNIYRSVLILVRYCDIMNAGAFIIIISKPLQMRRSEICSLHIGQLYHNASLL